MAVQADQSGAGAEREVCQHVVPVGQRKYGGRDLALRDQVRQEFPSLKVNMQVVRENINSENSFEQVVDMLDSNEALIKSGPRISQNQIRWNVVRYWLKI